MNLTWHIIKKDLYYFRWSFALWLGGIAYLNFCQDNAGMVKPAYMQDFNRVFLDMLLCFFAFALLVGLAQQDHPTESSGFWRTRPISAARLVTAKLLLVGALFVALPVLAIWVKNLFTGFTSVRYLHEYAFIALVLGSVTLSVMAAAACTKNSVQSLIVCVSLVFFTGSLAEVLSRYSPNVSRHLAVQMTNAKALSILGFSMAIALAIILNQYLRRRVSVSIVLFLAGAIGSALIGTMWGYFYFYSSQ